ncbi:hypothetical protein C8F01DRAFT_1257581 [Mycena amicta]|nr:hypothetical protein C8F01DRAFT_1257581 [Mycena amicta]
MATTRDSGVGMTMGRTSVNGLNGRELEASLRASPTLEQPELRDIRLLTATCHAPGTAPSGLVLAGAVLSGSTVPPTPRWTIMTPSLKAFALRPWLQNNMSVLWTNTWSVRGLEREQGRVNASFYRLSQPAVPSSSFPTLRLSRRGMPGMVE